MKLKKSFAGLNKSLVFCPILTSFFVLSAGLSIAQEGKNAKPDLEKVPPAPARLKLFAITQAKQSQDEKTAAAKVLKEKMDAVPDDAAGKFLAAYREFVAIPPLAQPPSDNKVAAPDDSTKRLAALRVMQFLGQRYEWLGDILLDVIMSEAPYYFLRFNPYRDKVTIAAGAIPVVPTRSAFSTPDTSPQGKNDPTGPLNSVQKLQNSDIALIILMVDTLKRLQKEKRGKDLYTYLRSDISKDIRVHRLVLSTLTDPDLHPDPNDMLDFLQLRPIDAPFARYFFVQRIITDPGDVSVAQIAVLRTQVRGDNDTSRFQSSIATQALSALKSMTSLSNLQKDDDYGFLGDIANLTLTSQDLDFQNASNDTLGSFVTIARKSSDKKKVLAQFVKQLKMSLETAQTTVGDKTADADQRTLCIKFITNCVPVLQSDSTIFQTAKVVEPLMVAFQDPKFKKKASDSRINVAKALAAIGQEARDIQNNIVGTTDTTTTYEIVRAALFNCSADEESAFLDAISAMSPDIKTLNVQGGGG